LLGENDRVGIYSRARRAGSGRRSGFRFSSPILAIAEERLALADHRFKLLTLNRTTYRFTEGAFAAIISSIARTRDG
jgi:hypothetical protein